MAPNATLSPRPTHAVRRRVSGGLLDVGPTQRDADPPPPLEAGDRLTAGKFLRRYEAMPDVHKAQLIEGIVHMPSPVPTARHGHPHTTASFWLTSYTMRTPGVLPSDNSTAHLDHDNVPQPDLFLRIPEAAGGATRLDERGHLHGPPELIVEIASSSASVDLHDKFHAYRRNGVREYIVWRTRERAVSYFILDAGEYVPLPPDENGLYQSAAFPGLWLDAAAVLEHDLARVADAVDRGCGTPDHAAFAEAVVFNQTAQPPAA